MSYTLTQEEISVLRSSVISIENTVGNYDIIYSGIVITEICIDSSCNVERNYTVDYVITNSWANNQTVEITITNIGDEPIRNWALQYDHHGTITNLWDGVLHNRNIIKSQMYNSDIAPGGSVTFGNFLIIEDSNGYYKLAGSHNGNIPINSSITLQFNGVMTTPPAPSNIVFSEMII